MSTTRRACEGVAWRSKEGGWRAAVSEARVRKTNHRLAPVVLEGMSMDGRTQTGDYLVKQGSLGAGQCGLVIVAHVPCIVSDAGSRLACPATPSFLAAAG